MEEPEDLGYEEQIPDSENNRQTRPSPRRQSTAVALFDDLTGALGYGTNMVGSKVGEALTIGAQGIAEVQKFSVGTFEDTKNYLGPEPLFMTVWLLWVAIGTLFYAFAPESNLGFLKGFFMAVNIGYSIGFGFPSEYHQPYYYFSVMYVLIGSSFVAVALGFFAEKIAEDQSNWFTIVKKRKKYEEAFAQDKSLYSKLKALVLHNMAVIRALTVWMVFIVVMITYSKVHVGWSITEAQYFAFSTLSTGGHHRIPDDSPPWFFGITGLFAMIGVPITGVAMAQVARGLTSHGDLEYTKSVINADVTAEELKMLIEFGLEDGDGEIDRSEFIILCMVRMGTSPELIDFISKRFEAMDIEGVGGLSIEQISRGNAKFVNGKVRRTASIVGENQAQQAMIASSLHSNLARELSLKKVQSLRKVKRNSMLARQQSSTNQNIAAFLDQFGSSSSDEEDSDNNQGDGADNNSYFPRNTIRESLITSQLADVLEGEEDDEEDELSSTELGYGLSHDQEQSTGNDRSSSFNRRDFTSFKRELGLGNTESVRKLEESTEDSGLRLTLDFPGLAPSDQNQNQAPSNESGPSLSTDNFIDLKRGLHMGNMESVRRLEDSIEDSIEDSGLRLSLDFLRLAPVESAPLHDTNSISPEVEESREHAFANIDNHLESRKVHEPFSSSDESNFVPIEAQDAQADLDDSQSFLSINVKDANDRKILEESFHNREIQMMLDFPGANISSQSIDVALSDGNESFSVATMEENDYDLSFNTPEAPVHLSSTCKVDLETVEELEYESSRGFRVSDMGDDIVVPLLEQGTHQVQGNDLDLQTLCRNASDTFCDAVEGNPRMLEEAESSDVKDSRTLAENFNGEMIDKSEHPVQNETSPSYPTLIPNASNEGCDHLVYHLPTKDFDIEASGGLEAIGKRSKTDEKSLDLREIQAPGKSISELRVLLSPDQKPKVVSDIETPPSSQLGINSTSSIGAFDEEHNP